jgi:hypothetical protein
MNQDTPGLDTPKLLIHMDFNPCLIFGHSSQPLDFPGFAALTGQLSTKLSTEMLDEYQSPDESST